VTYENFKLTNIYLVQSISSLSWFS